MPWVRFSDDWYDDDDLIAAGPLAMLLWPVLISWCARNLTDGQIHRSQVRRLVDWQQLGHDPEQAIAPLVTLGRLQDIAGDHLLVVNYHRYQPTREKVLADRESERVRKASARNPAGQKAVSGERPGHPVPVPVPVPVPNPSSSSPVTQTGLPADLWTRVAEKQASCSKTPIANPAAWKRKAAENARAELETRAIALIEAYDLTVDRLVDVLVLPSNPPWLNHHRRTA